LCSTRLLHWGMEDMAKTPFLERRGEVWWFRRKIEKDLLKHYAPKKEFRFSLKTKDRKEAEAMARLESVKLDQEFASARAQLTQEPKRTITDAEIARLEAIYYHQALEGDEEWRQEGSGEHKLLEGIEGQLQEAGVDYVATWSPEETKAETGLSDRDYLKAEEDIDICLPPAREWLARGNTKPFEWEIEEFLSAQGVQIDKKSKEYRKAALGILRAWVRSMETKQARSKGQIVDTPPAPEPMGGLEQPSGLTLSEAFKRWEREHHGPRKTRIQFWARIERFISMHGDLPVKAITKAHVREFKDAMMAYPARPPNEVRKLPVRQVIELYKDRPEVPRLKPQSINEGALAALRAVLEHAVSEGFIDHNPALKIGVKVNSNAEPSRLPYTDDDIVRIIAFPIFSLGERPEAGSGVAAVWLPLLAMYSGARLEELARLTRESFGTEEGVLYFRIQGRTKNKGSKRKVPVHSKLIELGFMRYVESITSGPIFPLMKWGEDEVSGSWSKWWGRYSRAQGITDERKVFHSFRHTVKRKIRNTGVDDALLDAVMGHKEKTEGAKYGRDQDGLGYDLRNLQMPIEALDYPEVNNASLKLL
jgi:integrase